MPPVRETIVGTIRQMLAEKGSAATPNDEAALVAGLGFDSLDLAVLVVRLEQQLGRDPFRSGRAPVATVGQLVAVYEEAAA